MLGLIGKRHGMSSFSSKIYVSKYGNNAFSCQRNKSSLEYLGMSMWNKMKNGGSIRTYYKGPYSPS